MKAKDRIGEKYNRLTITKTYRGKNRTMCECDCDCGAKWAGVLSMVVRENTKSCGCLKREWKNKPRNSFGRSKYCMYCGAPYYARGMCRLCYNRFRNNGTVAYKHERRQIVMPEVAE